MVDGGDFPTTSREQPRHEGSPPLQKEPSWQPRTASRLSARAPWLLSRPLPSNGQLGPREEGGSPGPPSARSPPSQPSSSRPGPSGTRRDSLPLPQPPPPPPLTVILDAFRETPLERLIHGLQPRRDGPVPPRGLLGAHQLLQGGQHREARAGAPRSLRPGCEAAYFCARGC